MKSLISLKICNKRKFMLIIGILISPFKNTIKIIIPLEQIDASLGAMKVLNIENSKNIILGNSINPDVEILGDQDDLFILKPNLCAHKAGIPVEGKSRKQLMLQLNHPVNGVIQ